MKLIKPSYQILSQKSGLNGIYEAIETAGRLCYKSTRPEGKTAKDFVDMLIKNGHLAMLEHGTVYLEWEQTYHMDYSDGVGDRIYDANPLSKYINNPYSKIKKVYKRGEYPYEKYDIAITYVTTNMRVLQEHNWLDDLQYLCEPTEFHEKRVTTHFTTSIGIGRELLRHRVFSFANESTRYCNYSSEKKFGSEITFIIPGWLNIKGGRYECLEDGPEIFDFRAHLCDGSGLTYYGSSSTKECLFLRQCDNAQLHYMELIKEGCTPQEAREVLPLPTKSELIMTGFISDWKHVFDLRSSIAATGKPHPDMVALIDPLMEEFTSNKYI